MKEYKFGDIVIVEFPFTDGKNTKKRPAMVLFYDKQDNELLLSRITSKIYRTNYDIELKQWRQSNLLLPSCVRLGKIATLHENLIYKKLGKIMKEDILNVKKIIKTSIQNL